MQCFGGAKNHMIVMPDADMDQAVDALVGAGYGSAGERCMAVSVAVPVGKTTADLLVEKLIPRVESLKIGPSTSADADFGPLVTAAHLKKVKDYVASASRKAPSCASTAATSRCRATRTASTWAAACSTRSSPTCASTRRRSSARCCRWCAPRPTRRACKLANDHEYGNGVAIFTRDGDAARDFAAKVNVGMVGVNVPIPVPLAYYTFGGWKRSGFGDLNQHGPEGVRFYTKTKTVTSRWPSGVKEGAEFVIPTMK